MLERCRVYEKGFGPASARVSSGARSLVRVAVVVVVVVDGVVGDVVVDVRVVVGDVVGGVGFFVRGHGHADGGVDLRQEVVLDVRVQDDAARAHLLHKVECVVRVTDLEMILDEEREGVSHADSGVDVMLLQQRGAHVGHAPRVRLLVGPRLDKVVHRRDARVQRCEALVAIHRLARLVQLRARLAQRADGLLVVSVLVNLHLRIRVVERGELLVRARLCVEFDNLLRQLGGRVAAALPVQRLQVVGGEDVNVAVPRDGGVVDDVLRVAGLEQALERL
mmetsp:Transcript_5723/g.20367  ORF Transcript_5723/g.20367 Transcript_5723/m.20367 type:complete len:278 (-) Transcript_5723:3989-4822(-)